MLETLLKLAGRLLARVPEAGLRVLAAALGDFVFLALPRRRRLILSNLHHAFADKPAGWHRVIGRESCRRLIETGLLSLAMPFLSERRLLRLLQASPALKEAIDAHRAQPRPTLFATAHLCGWESQTVMPLLAPPPFPEFGVIFRPLDHPAVDRWLKRTRERFGMSLLSRKGGFQEAMKILRRNGCIGLLFDQNAGRQGALTTLFDRICSTSELGGLLAEKFGAVVYALYPRRLGFWRIELDARRIAHDGTAAGVTLALNRWLESHLRADDDACVCWLWAHDRWRNQDVPQKRLRLEARRDLLDADLRARGLAGLPRRTRLWIRMPNWLGDVVMALPLLRALRASRPDAEITLLAKAPFQPLLERFGVADRVQPLPPRGRGYFRHFWRLRCEYPDCWLLLTNSLRGDIEAWLARSPQRFGLVRPRRRRPLLSHAWRVPADFDERRRHQVRLWEEFLRHFGLSAPPDFTPLVSPAPQDPPGAGRGLSSSTPLIGLICGSENNPEKRWPIAHWRALITRLAATRPGARFRLFGTPGDIPVANSVAFGAETAVENLAGRTDLAGFAEKLRECSLLVANDTGGMHLANALGVPLIALFGPTNPVCTGPVFQSLHRILQPPGCAPVGGGNLADLTPDIVLAAVDEMLAGRTPPV